MKKIILAAALAAAFTAQAGTVFTGVSKAGTIVNLNDTSSKMCRELASASTQYNYAESVSRDGMVEMKGCWTSYDDKVSIVWSLNGSQFTANWSWDAFNFTSYGERKYNQGESSKRNAGQQL